MSKKRTRRVKRRSEGVNLTKGKARLKSNRTKTRRYIIYGFGCLVLMQLVKFIVYNYIYVGSETPGGMAFLVVIYLQTGLMIGSLGFFAASAIAYLRSLKD